MFAIIGLGNPGKKYEQTRHNLGRMAVESFGGDWSTDTMAHARVAAGQIRGQSVALVLPETFMNKSGESARHFVPARVAADNLIVVYDDLALPFGEVKVSFGKGSGGHNGVQNIIDQVRTKDFVRVRLGIAPTGIIGKFFKRSNLEFVLKPFSSKEREELPHVQTKAREAIESIVRDGYQKAMNEVN